MLKIGFASFIEIGAHIRAEVNAGLCNVSDKLHSIYIRSAQVHVHDVYIVHVVIHVHVDTNQSQYTNQM